MSVSTILLLALAGFALASLLALWSYGRFARRAKGEAAYALPVAEPGQPGATPLDAHIAPLLAGRGDDEDGLLLLDGNLDAFALRALSARRAGRSLDLQYYLWHADLTGRLMVAELLAAADRGVRVRLLLDDLNARRFDRTLIALDAHPLIAVRLFNPARARRAGIRRAVEILLRAAYFTRRMHNKAWIADGRLAIVGGRNIGDAYFAAATAANFRDLDIGFIGPAVKQTEAAFDAFWNSAAAIPIAALRRRRGKDLARLRRRVRRWTADPRARLYLERVAAEERLEELLPRGQSGGLHWTRALRVLSDPPQKVTGDGEDGWLMREIRPLLQRAERELKIISPYFVPGRSGTEDLLRLAARGVRVAVLTNSLAATDVIAAHGAYAPCRAPLLAGGVAIYELKPYAAQRLSLFGSSSASLHTKAFTVDGRKGFVGSLNFDPLSMTLNTEMGVFFTDAALVARIDAIFADETAPLKSYRLILMDGRPVWEDGGAGEEGAAPQILVQEPQARFGRRLAAWLIGLLPIQWQL